jgi:hypothetical protein
VESQSSKQEGESKTEQSTEQSLPERKVVQSPEPSQSENTTQPTQNKPKKRCWRDKRWRHPQVIVNGALAFIAVIAAIIYYCQLQQMKRQLTLDQRAWVTVSEIKLLAPLKVGERPTLQVKFLNSGRTPALDAHGAGVVFIKDSVKESELVENVLSGGENSHAVIGPNDISYVYIKRSEALENDETFKAIEDGKIRRLFVFGVVWYKDIFGYTHKTRYCYSIFGEILQRGDFMAYGIGNSAD